jgi:hypothetical protein
MNIYARELPVCVSYTVRTLLTYKLGLCMCLCEKEYAYPSMDVRTLADKFTISTPTDM